MQRIVDSQQPHRPRPAQDQSVSLRTDPHHVVVTPLLQMIIGVESANDAGERLHQRSFKPGIPLPGEQAILRHHLIGDHHMGGFATDPWE